MKEDLNMYGNQMTYQLSCYMAGFIVGQIPLTMLATKLPINLYLPIMDSLWALFTLGCSRSLTITRSMLYVSV